LLFVAEADSAHKIQITMTARRVPKCLNAHELTGTVHSRASIVAAKSFKAGKKILFLLL